MAKLSNVVRTSLLLSLILVLTLNVATPVSGQTETSLSLALYVAPDRLPADGGIYSSLIIQLEDSGNPVVAPSDIQITLASTDETVGMVVPQITIPKGQIYIVTVFQTTRTPGVTTITALSQEAAIGSITVTTVIPTGTSTKLGIYAAPSSIPAEPGMTSRIIVQLEDSRGLPVRAPSNIKVSFTLTESSIGSVDSQAVIPEGETQTTTTFHANYNVGTTEIRASAKSYTSAATTLTTGGSAASTLTLYALPPKLHILDRFGWLIVQLQDGSGKPAKAPSDISVTLTSTNPNIAYAEKSVTIQTGKTQATTRVVLLAAGSVTVTALSEGYTPVSASITITAYTGNPNPISSLGLTVAPSTIPSDGGIYTPVAVQLLDSSGNPTWSAALTTVSFSLSNVDAGSASTARIEGMDSYALVTFQTTRTPGTTTMYTIAQGYSTASTTITTSGSLADRIALFTVPSKIYADNGVHESLIVQLQDSSNKPVKTQKEVILSLDSSNPEVGSVEPRAIIRGGSDHVIVQFHSTNTPGSTTIEAIAEGYAAKSVQITTSTTAPSAFALFAVPSKVVANGESYDSIFIKLLDSSGSLTIAWSDITLQLMSTNTEVGTADSTITIPKGRAFTVTKFHSGVIAGETTINALSGGFQLTTLKISTLILPASLNITVGPESITVGEESNLNITVTSKGAALPSAQMFLETDLGSFASNASTTDSYGNATTKYLSSQPGNATITVTVNKPGYEVVNGTIGIVVSPLPPPQEAEGGLNQTSPAETPEGGLNQTSPTGLNQTSVFLLKLGPIELGFQQLIIIGIVAAGAAVGAILFKRKKLSFKLPFRKPVE